MTKKEFKEHEWKVGETLYTVVYKQYLCEPIPWRIEKVEVSNIIKCDGGTWISFKKGEIYSYSNVEISTPYASFLKNFFFDSESANEAFSEIQKKFKKHRKKVIRELNNELFRLRRDYIRNSNKIYEQLRMNIMNE